jgi:hypothetical protein
LTVPECQQFRDIYITLHWILIPWVEMKQFEMQILPPSLPKLKKKKEWINRIIAHCANLNASVYHFTHSLRALLFCSVRKRIFWKVKFLLHSLACLLPGNKQLLMVQGWAIRELWRNKLCCRQFIIIGTENQCDSMNMFIPFWFLYLEYIPCLITWFVLLWGYNNFI